MKQQFVRVTDNNGKDWGVKGVYQIIWVAGKNDSIIDRIMIDFYGDGGRSELTMFVSNLDGTFSNVHGNLIAVFVDNYIPPEDKDLEASFLDKVKANQKKLINKLK